MSARPVVGRPISVKVDQQLYDDLETMMATGMTVSDAVRSALLIVAGTYRKVWDHTGTPHGVRPTVSRFLVTPYDAGQEPVRGAPQRSVPDAYRDRPTQDHTVTPAGMTVTPAGPTERKTV